MSEIITLEELGGLIGEDAYGTWIAVSQIIKSGYEAEAAWGKGGKVWDIEYKFSSGGKTLCGLYAKKDSAGLMIIFGRKERDKFESVRGEFSEKVQKIYDNAKTLHDGKWIMFPLDYSIVTPVEIEQLLFIKKKPNKKTMDKTTRISLTDISKGNISNSDKIKTNDMLYTYKRKTSIKDKTFKFVFEFDLTKEINEGDISDMIIYCCQRDIRMQEILKAHPLDTISDIIAIANEYRKSLLNT